MITIICEQCNNPKKIHKAHLYKKNTNGTLRKQKYCSRACSSASKRVDWQCLYCKKKKKVPRSRAFFKYCNRQCWGAHCVGENSHAWAGGKKLFVCDQCERKFPEWESNFIKYGKRSKNIFCGVECKDNFKKGKPLPKETKRKLSEALSGKKNPNYIHGMAGKEHNSWEYFKYKCEQAPDKVPFFKLNRAMGYGIWRSLKYRKEGKGGGDS
jgi:hypothetical protein